MNVAENNLIQLLTGKPSLQDVTIKELEEVANKYPYFSVAQLFLAKKISQSRPEDFQKYFQYCAIYFPDIDWLQGQIYNRNHLNIHINSHSIETAPLNSDVVEDRSAIKSSIIVDKTEKD